MGDGNFGPSDVLLLSFLSHGLCCRASVGSRNCRLCPLDARIEARYEESSKGQLSGNVHLPYKLWGLLLRHFLYERDVRRVYIICHVIFQISISKEVCAPAADLVNR